MHIVPFWCGSGCISVVRRSNGPQVRMKVKEIIQVEMCLEDSSSGSGLFVTL